tara:strand:- start:1325 stop:3232 length:1908 start_codon:yes stop_codon:yes gene_type:complete
MKISLKHILKLIGPNISIEELSEKLFQLGHEHEIENDIVDFEFTPNRGDCLSLNGILRDLKVFYDINFESNRYENDIEEFNFDFKNMSKDSCQGITFLKIDIEEEISEYKDSLKDYFNDLNLNKNNFFTDISNYISYETGQPTHCYDSSKINSRLIFQDIELDRKYKFKTLLGNTIDLIGRNSVFKLDDDIINLAGVVGNEATCCSKETRSVIVECAYFNPESIIGKSIKYDINSEAAHKFERGVDPDCHEDILRRFLFIVNEHSKIKSVKICSKNYIEPQQKSVKFDLSKLSKILGIDVDKNLFSSTLNKLGFKVEDNSVITPSYRHDIDHQNDLAEELARVIGYDIIPSRKVPIQNKKFIEDDLELKVKLFLVRNSFNEVINFPFVSDQESNSLLIDNPLDSNKASLRLRLKESLLNNLLYNERRQKDSIKLFEISDIYTKNNEYNPDKKIGIIASGRLGKNYKEFSKQIEKKSLVDSLMPLINEDEIQEISRDKLDSKIKSNIFYIESSLKNLVNRVKDFDFSTDIKNDFIKYSPISDYPMSIRDISFAISDLSQSDNLQELVLGYKNKILKEIFIFDFYHNNKSNILKIGFRLTFQSNTKTLTDKEVDDIMNDIIDNSLKINSVSVPGFKK